MVTRGFTIVELIITITIMGILLLLTVVNVNGTQLAARDDERVGDIEAIQALLETRYTTNGYGVYPSIAVTDPLYFPSNFPDADKKSFTAPGETDMYLTFISATNNVQSTSGVLPQPTIKQYVYQPIETDGDLCSDVLDCRKFNLYYRLEKDNTVYMVTSKNQ